MEIDGARTTSPTTCLCPATRRIIWTSLRAPETISFDLRRGAGSGNREMSALGCGAGAAAARVSLLRAEADKRLEEGAQLT